MRNRNKALQTIFSMVLSVVLIASAMLPGLGSSALAATPPMMLDDAGGGILMPEPDETITEQSEIVEAQAGDAVIVEGDAPTDVPAPSEGETALPSETQTTDTDAAVTEMPVAEVTLMPETTMDPSAILDLGEFPELLPEEQPESSRVFDTPVDVRELLPTLGGAQDSLINGLMLQFVEDGEVVSNPTEQADIEATLNLHLEEGLPANLRQDDWYIIKLSEGIVPVSAEPTSLMEGDIAYARVEIRNDAVEIQFQDGVRGLSAAQASFTVTAAFQEGAFAPGAEGSVALTNEDVPAIPFTMAEPVEETPVPETPAPEVTPTEVPVEAEPTHAPEVPAEPVDLREQGLVTGFQASYDQPIVALAATAEDAETEVTVTMNLTFTPELLAQLASGGTYTIALPDALRVAEVQTLSVVDQEGNALATAQVGPGREVVLTFAARQPETPEQPEAPEEPIYSGNGEEMPSTEVEVPVPSTDEAIDPNAIIEENETNEEAASIIGSLMAFFFPKAMAEAVADENKTATLTFTTVLDQDAIAAGASTDLTLPGEANAGSASLDMVAPLADGDWSRTDDTPMNVKDVFTLLGMDGQSILSDIHLEYTEPDGTETSDAEATVDASIKFTMDIEIPAEVTQNLREGDTYAVTLPPEIKVVAGGSYELYGPDGVTSYATAVVSTDGKVVFTFHAPIQTLGNAEGSFFFNASFDKGVIDTPGDHEIAIPGEPGDLDVTVNIKTQLEQEIDKQGVSDSNYNPQQVTWNVDFNKPAEMLTGAVLTDTIPDGLQVTDVKVYREKVDLDGNIIPGGETLMDPSEYAVDPATGVVTFSGTLDSAVRVQYVTEITGDKTKGDLQFVNSASLSSNETGDLTAQATVTARYGKLLDKRSSGYDASKQQFTWEIRYNYGEQAIGQSEAFITDTIDPSMDFDPDTLEVYEVSIDDNGTPARGALMGSDVYQVRYEGDQMIISFNDDVDKAYYITYKTHANGVVQGNADKVTNTVTADWNNETHSSGSTNNAQQQNVIKSVLSANDVNQSIAWKTELNQNRYRMVNLKLTDTLGKGVSLVEPITEMLTILDLDDSYHLLVQGTDYDFTFDAGTNSFVILFKGSYADTAHAFELVYYTNYDNTADDAIPNSIRANWEDGDGNEYSSDSTAKYPRTPVDVNNGEKYGVYNAVTKEITWYVLSNYHQRDFKPATLVDPIGGNQVYIRDSVRFYQYISGSPGNMGTEIPAGDAGIIVNEPEQGDENPTLYVTFPGGDDNDDPDRITSFWTVFRTSLAGELVNTADSYTNVAHFTANGNTIDLTGRVSVAHGGEYTVKSGKQDSEGYVNWSATLNGSQSTLESPVLTDTPSDNQRIDMSSLAIYGTAVDINGNITVNRREKLVEDLDYTATYDQNGSGTWVLTINFLNTIDKAYVMEYRTSVYMSSTSGQVTNHLHMEGPNGSDTGSGSTNSTVSVVVQNGGGTIYGKSGALTIHKLGVDGEMLAGAVLALHDRNGNRVAQVTVGESGVVVFEPLIQGTYTLYELSAPEGYTVSQELAYPGTGMSIQVDDNTTSGARIVQVQNVQTQAVMTKVDEAGKGLPGAVFHLEKLDEASGSYAPYGTDTYTSGLDGVVRVDGLPAGTYRFVEDTPPDGYIHNTDTLGFTLAPNAQGVTPVQDAGNLINYQGKVRIEKVDENGQPLAGAVFEAHNEAGQAVGRYTSGSDGIVVIDGLAPGEYLIREISAPKGYTLVSDPIRVTIPDTAAGEVTALQVHGFRNNPLEGGILFHKFDGDTGVRLAGVVFDIVERGTTNVVATVTTDADGVGFIDSLPVGDYSLIEKEAPAGYVKNSTAWDFTVAADENGEIEPMDIGNIDNYKGKISLRKVDENGNPLARAEFTLTAADGTLVGRYITGANGQINISGLAPGTYRLVETKAPDGYALTGDPHDIVIPEAAEGNLPPLTVGPLVNRRANGTILFDKVDGATGAALAGAVFEVVRADTRQEVATVTIGADGKGVAEGLEPGDYVLMEVTPPAGYILDPTEIPFTVGPDMDGTMNPISLGTLANYQGKVRIEKVDENGQPLAGATFEVHNSAGQTLGRYTSGSDGIIEIDGLAPGAYLIREVDAPEGYTLVSDPIRITIPSTAVGEVPALQIHGFRNNPLEGGVVFHKFDGDTGERLAGIVFQIVERGTDNVVATVTTDANGIGFIDTLTPGDYSLIEQAAPEGYIKNTTVWDFTVTDDGHGGIVPMDIGSIDNYRGRVSLLKVDEDGQPLAGAEFTLTAADGTTIGVYTTDAAGRVSITGLVPGTYRLVETNAPEGYALTEDPREIIIPEEVAGNLPPLTVGPLVNRQARGTVMFSKVDAATGAVLAGAVFQVLRADTRAEVATVTTDVDGQGVVESLAPGEYLLVETTPPAGYILNTTEIPFTVAADVDGTISPIDLGTIENFRGKVRIEKVDENGQPLAGATFEVHNDAGDALGRYTSDESGIIEIDGLVPGAYLIREISAPEGYTLVADPIRITIPGSAAGEVPPFQIQGYQNNPLEGGIVFHKFDGDTGERLAGVVFQIVEQGTDNVVATVTTDADGIGFIDTLAPGNYSLIEQDAPDGYVKNATVWNFTVADDGEGGIVPVDIGNIDNYRGKLTLLKVDESNSPLTGAEFTLTAQDGTVVGTYTTNASGRISISISGLAPGMYRLTETKAPEGYALIDDPRDVTIPEAFAGELPPLTLGQLVNPLANGTIEFRKVDADTNTQLPGAVFQVVQADTREEVATVTTDAYGRGHIDGLAPGDYLLIEVTPPAGYIHNTEEIPFTVTPDMDGTREPIDLGTIENIQGKAQLRKVDENGNPLAGATFTLTTATGRMIGTYKSDANGVVELYNLSPGTYRVRESAAPAGYELESDPIDFTIPADVEGTLPMINIGNVVNRRDIGAATIQKLDAANGTRLAGAVFQVIRVSTGAEVGRITTDSAGMASISGLEADTYQFIEVQAPYGYALSRMPITFTITADAATAPVSVTMTNERLPYTPTPTPSVRPTVPPGGPPQTGDSGTGGLMAIMALSATVFLGAAGMLVHLERKRKRTRG